MAATASAGKRVLTATLRANLNPVRTLYWTAVINGLLAPFLLTGILIAASDRTVMHGQPSSALGRVTVGVTAVAMFGAAIAMFLV
jgi:Mn2+/Fe2+ NRAMP family transporter